jgi:thiol-disulfide isomerase/thioredoxin
MNKRIHLLLILLLTFPFYDLEAGNTFYYLTFEGCAPCKKMLKEVFSNQDLMDRIEQDYEFRIIDRDKPEDSVLIATYSKNSYPLMVFVDEDGVVMHQHAGALSIDGMYKLLDEIAIGITLKEKKEAFENNALNSREALWEYLSILEFGLEISSDEVKRVWEKWIATEPTESAIGIEGAEDLKFIGRWMMLPGMDFVWEFEEEPIQRLLENYEEAIQVYPDTLVKGRLAFLMIIHSMAEEETFEPKSFRKGMEWMSKHLESTEILVLNDSGKVVSFIDLGVPAEALAVNFSIWTGDTEYVKKYLPSLLGKLQESPEMFYTYLEYLQLEYVMPQEILNRFYASWRKIADESTNPNYKLMAAKLSLSKQDMSTASYFLESGLVHAEQTEGVYQEIEKLLSELID